LEEEAWERECKLEAWRGEGEAGRVARWTDRATQLLRAEKGAHAALRDASCELRGVEERAAAQEEVDWALDNRVASTSSAASLLRQLPPASSDEEGGVGGAQSRRRVPLRSRRTLAATLTQLEAHAHRAACCAAAAGASSSSSDSEAPARRVPHCFQDDADGRSGSSSDSGRSDEMACDSLDSEDALPEWRCGPFTAPEQYRRIRMPSPEPCSSHEDEGDEGFNVQELRDAMSRFGAGEFARNDFEACVQEALQEHVDAAVAALAQRCDPGALLAAAAAACAARPLVSYADL
jgi:hypothetical protein